MMHDVVSGWLAPYLSVTMSLRIPARLLSILALLSAPPPAAPPFFMDDDPDVPPAALTPPPPLPLLAPGAAPPPPPALMIENISSDTLGFRKCFARVA